MHRPPRWMAIYPDDPQGRDRELRKLEEQGCSRLTAKWWYWLRKLGPSAEYDLPPKDNDVSQRRMR